MEGGHKSVDPYKEGDLLRHFDRIKVVADAPLADPSLQSLTDIERN